MFFMPLNSLLNTKWTHVQSEFGFQFARETRSAETGGTGIELDG
jgi:hypothetical protein